MARGDDLPLLRLLLCRIGDDDGAGGRLRALDPLDDEAIVERPDVMHDETFS
jgi:hypothetical protein